MNRSFHNKAFSLIEMLVYIAILSILFLVIVNTSLSFTSSYRTLSALSAADHAATDTFEPMTRYIRAASSIVSSSAGSITLSQTSNGNSTTTQFYLQNGAVQFNLNGVYYGPLSASNADVTSLVFSPLSTTTASAVKIDMTVVGESGSVTETEKYHTTVILLGSSE